MKESLLKIERLNYRYPGASLPALSGLSCTVEEGECVCLTGNSGCGKSTLLLAIMGLLRGGSLDGTIDLGKSRYAGYRSCAAGMVFQNPESQLLCTSVAEEVAFGPENLCVPPAEIARRVGEALQAVGLAGQEGRSPERFSAGQKQRLTIASVLSMNPGLLLLDEPTSQLDVRGKLELAGILAGLKLAGYTIVLAEHDPRPFADLIDRYLVLEGGRLSAQTGSLPNPGQYLPRGAATATQQGAPQAQSESQSQAALEARSASQSQAAPEARSVSQSQAAPEVRASAMIDVAGLGLSYPETGAVLKQLQLRVHRGERVHLFGGNGAGKSSLLRCLAGLESPDAGTLALAGLQNPRPEQLAGRVGVLFQNPARQLFSESVQQEVAFSLRRLGHGAQETGHLVAEALVLCGIGHLAGRAPLTLSFGEQHRVALAAVLAPRPELLLLDEPFAGLDYPQRLTLLDILAQLPGRYGSTVLIASHDELPDTRWADRSYELSGGTLEEIRS